LPAIVGAGGESLRLSPKTTTRWQIKLLSNFTTWWPESTHSPIDGLVVMQSNSCRGKSIESQSAQHSHYDFAWVWAPSAVTNSDYTWHFIFNLPWNIL